MDTCTVTKNLEIVTGTRADYESLSHYHYRESHIGPCAAIYALKGKFRTAEQLEVAGVIVYSVPTAGAQMRNIATDGIFAGLDKSTQLKLINKNIRTISRVIIEPRFRSLGLAVRLVKKTMPLMNISFVEALAVMGRVNPFFEKAGMTRYDVPISTSCVRLVEAFSAVGIDDQDLIDPAIVQEKLEALQSDFVTPAEAGVQKTRQMDSRLRGNDNHTDAGEFIEAEMTRFLQCYGHRRLMQPGIVRTRFILNKLTDSPRFAGEAGRPVYYMWQNPNLVLRV
jgi:hypothetical protein